MALSLSATLLKSGLGMGGAGVYSTTSCGATSSNSRDATRREVKLVASSRLKSIQPKLTAGWLSHPWTSATSSDVEGHVYDSLSWKVTVELTAAAKSVPDSPPP